MNAHHVSALALVFSAALVCSCAPAIPVESLVPLADAPEEPEPEPERYTITVEEAAGGTVTVKPDREYWIAGEYALIVATPLEGWYFSGWSGTESGSAAELFITVAGDEWLIPHFAPSTPAAISWKVTAIADGNGTVVLEPDRESYADGETVKVCAIPEAGYAFAGWDGALSGSDAETEISVSADTVVTARFVRRQWTIVIYMAADNDLESAAMLDMNELEAAGAGGPEVSVLALVDRASGYDATNGDWTGTRLFELASGAADFDTVLSTREIDCPPLGLVAGANTELDLAEPTVLDCLLSFASESYDAEHTALVVWGHGTGWRGGSGEGASSFKAVAFDDTSGNFMTLPELAGAIEGKSLSVIGFDTCFAAILELAYELRSNGGFLAGTPGMAPSTGWDYARLLDAFSSSDRSPDALCAAMLDQYRAQYSGVPGASFSVVDLTMVDTLFSAFDAFGKNLARCVLDAADRTAVRQLAVSDSLLYGGESYPCDVFIDIGSLCAGTAKILGTLSADASRKAAVSADIADVTTALLAAIPSGWSAAGSGKTPLGVHLAPFILSSVPRAWHDALYVKNSGTLLQSRFVLDSTGWVPNSIPADSLLDILFYSTL